MVVAPVLKKGDIGREAGQSKIIGAKMWMKEYYLKMRKLKGTL